MKRVLEPELMDDAEQARAYAEADFSEPNQLFVALFRASCPDETLSGTVLDLGCGPADIPLRLASAYSQSRFHVVDGSGAMLEHARQAWAAAGMSERVVFIEGRLPDIVLPKSSYDAIISNSLLHQLHFPEVLWSVVKSYGRPGAVVLIMDLERPQDVRRVDGLVKTYAWDAPVVLRRDFRNSLLAAFRVDEVRLQLEAEGLSCLGVKTVSDRHLAVSGRLP